MLALVVIMAILLAWALVAGRLARWSITAPLTMVVAGVALTAGSNPRSYSRSCYSWMPRRCPAASPAASPS